MDVRLAFQMDRGVHRDDGLVRKTVIGSLFFLVGIGLVVKHLFHFP